MLYLNNAISLRQKVGAVLGGTFLTLSLGACPAIAQDMVDDYFTVEYLQDDDNYAKYKLIVISDFEMHNSVITTIDLFEKAINSFSDTVVINGITFHKKTLRVSQLESYDNISNKDNIIIKESKDLDFQYIYDDDHSGKYSHDNGTYKLVALSDYERNISIVTTVSIFENLLQKQNGDIIMINGYPFDREELLCSINRSLDGMNDFSIEKSEKEESSFIDIEYIYDDNHSNNYSLDEGDYKLVTVADYEGNNVVTMTVEMFEHVVNHTHGDVVVINGIEFDRDILLNVKEQADIIKSESEKNRSSFNSFSLGIIIGSSFFKSVAKTIVEESREKRYYRSW